MNRQKIRVFRVEAVEAANVVTAIPQADHTMTRFRPSRSATVPMSGAASATPAVAAVIVRLTATFEAPNTDVSSGNRGCVAYSVRNAVKPANTTAMVRRAGILV